MGRDSFLRSKRNPKKFLNLLGFHGPEIQIA